MPPITCTSKGRIPRVRRAVSRTTANASGRMSSRVSPAFSLSRNSSVFARSAPSESFSTSGSSAETPSTARWRTLTLRPSPILKIFVSRLATGKHQPRFRRPLAAQPACRPTRPPLSVRYLRLSCGLYEPVVSITTPVDNVYVAGICAGEDEEVMVEELHLQHSLLGAHRLHLELLGAHDPCPDLLFLVHDEGLHLALDPGVVVLEMPLPAVDLAPPVTPHLALEFVRHAVYGGVHVLGGFAGLQDRPVDEQGSLRHLGLGDRRVALVGQLDLRPRSTALVVKELGYALDLLPRVTLKSLSHQDVAPLDRDLHEGLLSLGGLPIRML